ncbi:hypothetical protein [Pseudosulfitobacter sp. SM2401]|uniref:CBU_0592 family membrane protein n=1 Tax=Pseudosulfitobacter sp. SM2401 TaxID=3350098 RepID=UPI0036F2F380
MNFIIVNPDVFEMIGVAGFALYVINYSLLTLRFMDGHSLSYFILNLLAAAFVLVGLTVSFNLASAMIQLFWVAMSSLGIALRLARPTPALA